MRDVSFAIHGGIYHVFIMLGAVVCFALTENVFGLTEQFVMFV